MGCTRATRTGELETEADLEPLSIRAKQLVTNEAQRVRRLPPGDPVKQLLNHNGPPPRLKYRARRAWIRDMVRAAAAGEPTPPMCDEDLRLIRKPYFFEVASLPDGCKTLEV